MPSDSPPPRDPAAWAELLKTNWGARAQSEARDFYVASHAGWDDPQRWEHQARADIKTLLFGLDEEWLRSARVLEIGCGVGRLAPLFLEVAADYTGFDIATGMVEEARKRLAGEARARFLESDGRGVPAAAQDRRYDLAVSLAVFIHCPRSIVEELARSAFDLLNPGGRLRFQLMGDPADPTGIQAPPAVEAATQEELDGAQDNVTPAVDALIDEHYIGHAFTYAEAQASFEGLGGSLQLYRFDPCHIYGEVCTRLTPATQGRDTESPATVASSGAC